MARKPKLPSSKAKRIRWNSMVLDPSLPPISTQAMNNIKYCKFHSRLSMYSIETIFNKVGEQKSNVRNQLWNMNGEETLVKIDRIETFKRNPSCMCCGITGSVFVMERHHNRPSTDRYILALYGIDINDEPVSITIDHILPDSMGGQFASSNFQVMCKPCNNYKAHLLSQPEIDQIRTNPTLFAKHWVNIPLLLAVLTLRERCLHSTPDQLDILTAQFESARILLAFGTDTTLQAAVVDSVAPIKLHNDISWYGRAWKIIVNMLRN